MENSYLTKKKILITGGAGYIGSHCVVEFAKAGFQPLIVDNFSNSSHECLTRLEALTGQKIECIELDLLNKKDLDDKVFKVHAIYAVAHLAAFKNVRESVFKPIEYYKNNVAMTINLLEVTLYI